MSREEFICALRGRLGALGHEEAENTLSYYSEMISDKMDEGMSEEEAVASLGTPQSVAAEILMELPIGALVRSNVKKRRNERKGIGALGWVLIVVGCPLWLPLLLTAALLALTLFALLWVAVAVLWSVFAGVAAAGALGVAGTLWALVAASGPAAALMCLGGGITAIGLAIVAFMLVLAATRAIARFTMLIPRLIKRWIIGRRVI